MRIFTLTTIIALTALFSGCSPTAEISTDILAKRELFVLSEEPDGAMGVVEAKEALKQNDDVVLIGRIGAGDHSPWENGKASFMVADPSE
jgi:hypothetical protein